MFSKLFLMRSNVNKPLGILPPLTPPEDWGGIRVLLFLILASSAFAQPFPPDSVWTFAFDDGGDEYFYDAIEVEDGFLLCGEAREWNALAGEALLVKIDRQGELVASWRENNPTYYSRLRQFERYPHPHTIPMVVEIVNDAGVCLEIYAMGYDSLTNGLNIGHQIAFGVETRYHLGYVGDIIDSYHVYSEGQNGGNESFRIHVGYWDQSFNYSYPRESNDICTGGIAGDGIRNIWVFGKARQTGRSDFDCVALRAFRLYTQYENWATFSSPLDDSFYDGVEISDHDAVLTGTHGQPGRFDTDLFIVSLADSTDIPLWSHHYGGLAYEDGVEIVSASDNGFIIAGNFSSENINFEQSDYWLLKVDEDGDSVWSVVKGGDEADRCEGMIETENGFLLFGSSQSFAVPGWDGCAMYLAYVPDIAAAPGSLNFGPVAVGLNATRTLGLINTGSNVLTVTEIQGSGDYSTAFTGPATVEIGDTLRVDILFTPQSVGNHVDTLRIFSNAISGVKTVRCLGAGTAANADEESLLPTEFKLHPPYPNPFNPTTTIAFDMPTTQSVALNLYDVSGRLVRELVQQEFAAGRQRVSIDGNEMASGIYFVSMVSGEFQAAQKLVLMK